MTTEQSLNLSGKISAFISGNAPYVEYTPDEVREAEKRLSPEKKRELTKAGYLGADFEKYYVLDKFARAIGLYEKADGEYMKLFFSLGRKFEPSEFSKDPFIERVKIKEHRIGDYLLTNATYSRGEFFQYSMPDLRADTVVPKIGFFTGEVSFPAVYEGDIPWMSACPSEISSMSAQLKEVNGRVLVLGLGLGYFPFVAASKKEVESITVIEIQPEIIRLFKENILPHFPNPEKITVIKADAFSYLKTLKGGEFDCCFADIWEGQEDGAECYKKIKPFEAALPSTSFSYWIEDEIRWYIERNG